MSVKLYDVVGVGNALVDVVAHVDDSLLHRFSLTKGAMRLTSAAESDALYKAMPPATETSGGSGANTIAALASLGSRTAFVSRIGADEMGDVFAHDIRAQGVTFTPTERDQTEPTGRCLILVTPDAERTMNTSLACNLNFSTADLSHELIAAGKVLYLEGYLFDQLAAKEAFIRSASWARAAEGEVALTLSDSFCVQRHRADFLKLVEQVDVLFANEHEIMALYETDSFEAAAEKARAACKLAVLTRSAKGATIVRGNDTVSVPAVKVEKVVDLTGAGDAYAAGFLHGYTQGLGLAECAQLGALAAAEVIGHLGARPEVKLSDYVAQHKAA